MSWSEVKKINSDLSLPSNFLNYISDIETFGVNGYAINSSNVMDNLTSNKKAMDFIILSNIAREVFLNGSFGVGNGFNTLENLNNNTLKSLNSFQDVVDNSSVMDNISTNTNLVNLILNSPTIRETFFDGDYSIGQFLDTYGNINNATLQSLNTMTEISNNSTALSEIVTNTKIMTLIANSPKALSFIFDSWLARETIWDNESASAILMSTDNASRNWMITNKSTEYTRSVSSFGSGIAKKGFLLRARSGNTTYSVEYRYIQPSNTSFSTNSTSNVNRFDRVSPLELRITASSGTGYVTYIRMEE
jgi:hypothetical protein